MIGQTIDFLKVTGFVVGLTAFLIAVFLWLTLLPTLGLLWLLGVR